MKWQVQSSKKLVSFLQEKAGAHSGKLYRKVLESNFCRVNGKVERFGSSSVQKGDTVELCDRWQSVLKAPKKTFEVLFEDDDMKIINKPDGFVCHDDEVRKVFGSNHFLVHRLDKDTTGVLLLAKNQKVKDQLMDLFQKRQIHKEYLALVDGAVKTQEGTIESLFTKKGSFEGQTIWGSSSQGLTAITNWKKIATSNNATLMLCMPFTGRTHQIRVHMAEMGHPILVDRQYAKNYRCKYFSTRPLLHAKKLRFTFNDKLIDIEALLPQDFIQALGSVKIENPDC